MKTPEKNGPAPGGWSAEMDRKLDEMKADPEGYFKRARKQAAKDVRVPLRRPFSRNR